MQLPSTPSVELFQAAGKDLKISSLNKASFCIPVGYITLKISKNKNVFGIEIKGENKKTMHSFERTNLQNNTGRENDLKFTCITKKENTATVISGAFLKLESFKEFLSQMSNIKKTQGHSNTISLKNTGSIQSNVQSVTPNNKVFATRKEKNETSDGLPKIEHKTPQSTNENYRYRDLKENSTPKTTKRSSMKPKSEDRTPLEPKKFYNNQSTTITTPKQVVKSETNSSSKSMFPKIPNRRFNLFGNKKKITEQLNEANESAFEKDSIIGFANLGNTCYMNAILQCLLNIPNFYQELHNENNLALVPIESLYKRLSQLGFAKHNLEGSETQKKHLQLVKESISSAANRFLGYSQHDAHEFLCQCMDQLKEDLLTQMIKKKDEMQLSMDDMKSFFVCPIKENFETTVYHSIRCLGCKEQIIKEEEYHDFSLVIPEYDENFNPGVLSIGKLLNLYFADEEIEYTCEICNSSNSVLTHQMKKLPRILVLHLKRYDSFESKKSDSIKIPKVMDVSKVVSDEVVFPSNFDLDCSLWKESTVKSGIKRKSEDSSSLSSAPSSKAPKVNRDSYINATSAAEMLAISARESRKDDRTSTHNFTKIGPRKSLNFTTDINCDIANEIKIEPILSTEERQIKEAMELSMQEYESQQRLDMSTFLQTKQTSTPAPSRAESIFQTSSDSDKIPDEKQSYHLVGVVNHHGTNTVSGHYTCDCYDFKSKQWRNYNDSSVQELDEFDWSRRSTSAYIVFYMHDICFQSIQNKY